MTHQLTFEAYGVAVRVRTSSQELLARVEPVLPPGWRPSAAAADAHTFALIEGPDGEYSIFNAAELIEDQPELRFALGTLGTQVRVHVAQNAPGLVFVHAGVVGHRGRALVLPGASFAGKSTAVAALVRAGATYYSDEFAVFDASGLVHPYATRLSLRSDWARNTMLTVEEHTAESLGGVTGQEPLPLGVVAITGFVRGAQWHPRRLSAGETVLELVSSTIPPRRQPGSSMPVLSRAVRGAICLEGDRGEADAFAHTLLDLAAAQ